MIWIVLLIIILISMATSQRVDSAFIFLNISSFLFLCFGIKKLAEAEEKGFRRAMKWLGN